MDFEFSALYEKLTARENLRFFAFVQGRVIDCVERGADDIYVHVFLHREHREHFPDGIRIVLQMGLYHLPTDYSVCFSHIV